MVQKLIDNIRKVSPTHGADNILGEYRVQIGVVGFIVRVIQGSKGVFVSLPSYKFGDEYRKWVNIPNRQDYDQIIQEVLDFHYSLVD